MKSSPERRVTEDIDLSGPKELIKTSNVVVKEIATITRGMKSNLLQNEIHITPKTTDDISKRKYSLKLMQNGVEAEEYDFHISINTSKESTPIYISIGGTIPIKKGTGEISNVHVVTDRGAINAKGLLIDVLPNRSVTTVKDNLVEKEEIIDIFNKSVEEVADSLSDGDYKTDYVPKEIDRIEDGLSEIPINLN